MKWDTSTEFDPVILRFDGNSEHVIVHTVQEAADALIKNWPADDGEEYFSAVKACLDVMARKAEPEQLREALLRAAEEAGVTIVAILH